MSNKKLPTSLQKVLDSHKQAWAVDDEELAKRINNAKTLYFKASPHLNDRDNYSNIVIFRKTFVELLQALKSEEFNELSINYSRSTATGGYKVSFIKGEVTQQKDLKRITQAVTEAYMQSLDAVKQEYIENLLHEYEEQQAIAKATQEKEQQAKLRQQLLSMLD